MFNFIAHLHQVLCDCEALNRRWLWLSHCCPDMDKIWKAIYYFDSVQIPEQFPYVLKIAKAVLPH